MFEPLALHIASLFLFMSVCFIGSYLWRRAGFSGTWIPIRPGMFLLAAGCSFVLGAACTALLGIERALFGLSLGLGIVFSVMHPVAAVSFFVANLILRIWELGPPHPLMAVMPRFLAALCMFSWVVYGVRTGNFRIIWNWTCFFFVLLVGWLLVSAMLSGDMATGVHYLFAAFVPISVLAFLILNAVDDALDLSAVTSTLILAVTGVICVAIYTTLSDPLFYSTGLRLGAPGQMGNANDLASMIVLVLPLVVFPVLLRRASVLSVAAGLLCLTVLLVGLWLSQSRGALLALLVGGFIYLILFSASLRRVVVLGAVLVLVPLIIFLTMHRETSDAVESRLSRMDYAMTGFRMLKTSPLWGVGIGNYPKLYPRYTELYLEQGERTAHSTWILVMAEAGLVGLAAFVALFVAVLVRAWRQRLVAPEYFLSVVGYGVAMSFLSHTYLILPYVLFALVLAATRVHAAATNSAAAAGAAPA